jgi:two-component system KDP operon response regulator KdpE
VSRVLVVDDDPLIVRALRVNMRARGYEVHTARDGASALWVAGLHPPDLVVLDLCLPDMQGTEVIDGLRGWTTAPIIVLTGRTEQIHKTATLDAGADDYVTKPFGIEELFARMRAVSRRVTVQHTPGARVGKWVVDLTTHRVRPASGAGDDQKLTPTEWRILEILIRNPSRLITKKHLLHEVWGPGYDTETNYLRLYLAQLRRKLEPNPARPAYLLTETGMGYRFEPSESDPQCSSMCSPSPLAGRDRGPCEVRPATPPGSASFPACTGLEGAASVGVRRGLEAVPGAGRRVTLS